MALLCFRSSLEGQYWAIPIAKSVLMKVEITIRILVHNTPPKVLCCCVLSSLLDFPQWAKHIEHPVSDLFANTLPPVLPHNEKLSDTESILCGVRVLVYQNESCKSSIKTNNQRSSSFLNPIMVEIFVAKQSMIIQVAPFNLGKVVLVELHHMLKERLFAQSGFGNIYLHVIFLKHNGARITRPPFGRVRAVVGRHFQFVAYPSLSVLSD